MKRTYRLADINDFEELDKNVTRILYRDKAGANDRAMVLGGRTKAEIDTIARVSRGR